MSVDVRHAKIITLDLSNIPTVLANPDSDESKALKKLLETGFNNAFTHYKIKINGQEKKIVAPIAAGPTAAMRYKLTAGAAITIKSNQDRYWVVIYENTPFSKGGTKKSYHVRGLFCLNTEDNSVTYKEVPDKYVLNEYPSMRNLMDTHVGDQYNQEVRKTREIDPRTKRLCYAQDGYLERAYYVMPDYGLGLDEYINLYDYDIRFAVKNAMAVIKEVTELFEKKKTHGDLKIENICYSVNNDKVTLFDFSTSYGLDEIISNEGIAFTRECSHSIINENPTVLLRHDYRLLHDLWSLTLVCKELFECSRNYTEVHKGILEDAFDDLNEMFNELTDDINKQRLGHNELLKKAYKDSLQYLFDLKFTGSSNYAEIHKEVLEVAFDGLNEMFNGINNYTLLDGEFLKKIYKESLQYLCELNFDSRSSYTEVHKKRLEAAFNNLNKQFRKLVDDIVDEQKKLDNELLEDMYEQSLQYLFSLRHALENRLNPVQNHSQRSQENLEKTQDVSPQGDPQEAEDLQQSQGVTLQDDPQEDQDDPQEDQDDSQEGQEENEDANLQHNLQKGLKENQKASKKVTALAPNFFQPCHSSKPHLARLEPLSVAAAVAAP